MISDDEKNDYINRSVFEINRINTIIKQLLDFSRPGTEILKSVPVHAIIKDVVNILNVQPGMKNIDFEYMLNSETDTVKADPEQLKQVFINLIINAADAIVEAIRLATGPKINPNNPQLASQYRVKMRSTFSGSRSLEPGGLGGMVSFATGRFAQKLKELLTIL